MLFRRVFENLIWVLKLTNKKKKKGEGKKRKDGTFKH